MIISASDAFAFSNIEGYVPFPTIAFTSNASSIFWISSLDGSITVIDPSSEDIQKIDDALDVKAIVGKGTYPSILEKANAAETDMIIAVTRNDEINMLICQIAFSIFKIPKKIARIRSQDYLNPKFTRVYNKENLPIDVIISPEKEIAMSIQRKLEAPGASSFLCIDFAISNSGEIITSIGKFSLL